jgi:hypothetical protein
MQLPRREPCAVSPGPYWLRNRNYQKPLDMRAVWFIMRVKALIGRYQIRATTTYIPREHLLQVVNYKTVTLRYPRPSVPKNFLYLLPRRRSRTPTTGGQESPSPAQIRENQPIFGWFFLVNRNQFPQVRFPDLGMLFDLPSSPRPRPNKLIFFSNRNTLPFSDRRHSLFSSVMP